MESIIRKWFRIVGLSVAAIAAGFFMSLGLLGANPLSQDLFAVVRGLAESPVGSISSVDKFAAGLWEAGGAGLLSLVRWIFSWVAWTLGIGLLFALVALVGTKLPPCWRRRTYVLTAIVVVSFVVVAVVDAVSGWSAARRPLALVLPVDLVAALPENADVYASPALQSAVVLLGNERGIRLRAGDAVPEPSAWREAIRREPVSHVLLSGSTTSPLLDHLLQSSDWHLSTISPHGWVFVRGPGHNIPPGAPGTVDLGNDRDNGIYLAMLSARLIEMSAVPEARVAIENALKLAPEEPEVLLHAALFNASLRRWRDVATYAEQALRHGADRAYSLTLLANARMESGNAGDAGTTIQKALAANSSNPQALFLAAKIFRNLNDYSQEAEVLERLVRVSEKHQLPTGGSLAYLGQSYAQVGNAPAAISAYRRAIESGDLDATQEAAVRESLDLIETRTSIKRSPAGPD